MGEVYSVRLNKEYLVFSAAHFITFAGNICERLHGHNYRVEAEVIGALDENQYVIDFIALRDRLKQLVDALDHHVLLPTKHTQIHVAVEDEEVVARFENRRWVFPRADCVLLPIANTTAERLAWYLATELRTWMNQTLPGQIQRLRIGVDENFGQWGICELDLRA